MVIHGDSLERGSWYSVIRYVAYFLGGFRLLCPSENYYRIFRMYINIAAGLHSLTSLKAV